MELLKNAKKAGIRPIMITGDHKDTAVAIAKDLKIIKDEKEAITGAELEELSDEEFVKVVKKCSVYARVQPEHKTRIVKTLKSLNLITAMTGDGVNDAPSIKAKRCRNRYGNNWNRCNKGCFRYGISRRQLRNNCKCS